MIRKICAIICSVFLLSLIGCGKHSLEKQKDIFDSGATNQFGPMYVAYDDELKTGGGLFFFPGGEHQSIDLSCTDKPFGGKYCIRYSWDGGEVFNYNANLSQNTYAGVSFAVSSDRAGILTQKPRDYSQGAYTKVVFHARGSLTPFVKVRIEAPDDADTSTAAPKLDILTLSSDWQEYSFPIDPASSLSTVREFFKCTFIFSNPDGTTQNGEGGTIFLDNIYYEK